MPRDSHWKTQGLFWIEEDPERMMSGRLSYSPAEGAALELIGILADQNQDIGSASSSRLPTIHGTTKEFHRVEIFDALEGQRTLAFGRGMNEQAISSTRVLTTNSAHDISCARLLKLRISIEGLEKWLNISGFTHEFIPGSTDITTHFHLPDMRKFAGAEFKLEVAFGQEGPTFTRPTVEVLLRQSCYLDILPLKPTSLDDLLPTLKLVTDFVSLGMGIPCEISRLQAEFAIPASETGLPWGEIWLMGLNEEKVNVPRQHEMLFTFQDIEARFESMLRAWSASSSVLKPLHDLYSSTIRSTAMYSQHRLANFFQALEFFHRQTDNPCTPEKEESLKKRDRILCTVDQSDRNWLTEKLAFAHEPSASERIKNLVGRFNAEWIFPEPWENSIQRIANVRNFFTHYGRKPPDEDLKLVSVANFGSRLQVLCEVALLSQLGFTLTEIHSLMRSKRRLPGLLYHDD